ncbi:MAG: DUF6183 family protein [Acidimicrobiia bacterium]
MISSRATEAIEASDTDELLRVVDSYCASRSWDELVELRHRCHEAVGRGKQLWGVEEHIRYRLALEAPPSWAGPVVSEGWARFALGPLAEVAASTKTWAEMEPHLEPGPEQETFAAERVVRGDTGIAAIPDLPPHLESWEPRYPVATYKADKVEAPSPPPPVPKPTTLPSAAHRIADPVSEGALSDLVQPWTDESNGRCDTAAVEGDASAAVRALGLTRARMAPISLQEALAWMGWADASGGAHGRRRGAAAGRYGAWWVLASLADLDWPPRPDELGRAAQRFRWFWFDDGSPGTGWQLRLAVEDPESGLAWSVAAVDAAD